MSAGDVLVWAEGGPEGPADITGELLGAARPLAQAWGGQVVALAAAPGAASWAPALPGADRVVAVESPMLEGYCPPAHLAVLEEAVRSRQPAAVLLGSTTVGLDLGPLLAARLDAPLLKNCQEFQAEDGRLAAVCRQCGGKLLADAAAVDSPAVALILPGCFHPPEGAAPGQLEEASPPQLEDPPVRFVRMIQPETTDVDITQQDVLVAVGRGIQQEDNLELAEELAEALGGAVAGSRPVVDQGWLPPTRQVGKSGMIVKPKLYLALGISGAPEHQEGMQRSDLIIAVNTDPNAPIFDIAHYGAQVDLLDLAPALAEAVREAKGSG